MLDNPNSNVTFVRRSYSAPELRLKANKALYLSSNPCEVPIIVVRVLVLLHARFNLSQGLFTHKCNCEKYFIDFAYRCEPEVQLKLYNLVLKFITLPVEYVRLRYLRSTIVYSVSLGTLSTNSTLGLESTS